MKKLEANFILANIIKREKDQKLKAKAAKQAKKDEEEKVFKEMMSKS